jgi:hypothetical protein
LSKSGRIARCESQLRDFLQQVIPFEALNVLSRRMIEGKWSALENLAHLGRYHEVFLERLERMLREPNPSLPRYRAEDDSMWETWRNLPPAEVLARLSSLRTKLIDRLRSLRKEDFDKTGVHPKFGKMAISLWLEFFLVHEGHHLYLVLQQVRTATAS